MNTILTELGIPSDIQAYFKADSLQFDYGDNAEVFGKNFHKVPTSEMYWFYGSSLAKELVITSSAMEAIAYLSLNRQRHPEPFDIAFMAIGNTPHQYQFDWIRLNFKRRKCTLVLGNDLLGTLADIKVAAGLNNKPLKVWREEEDIQVEFNGSMQRFAGDRLTLYNFERAFGIRAGARTRKPKIHINFLTELMYHADR